MDDEGAPLGFHNRREVWRGWVDDDGNDCGDGDFDIGHVSHSSCDGEMEQESTDTDTGNAGLFDTGDKENSNMSTYLTR